MPRIRSHHGASRRSQCRNNLKQIGLALHNYEELFRTLPPGIVNAPAYPGAKTSSNLFSWNQLILPQFDQGPLGKKFDPHVSILNGVNPALASSILPSLRCPHDVGPEQVNNGGSRGRTSATIASQATSNYVANFGVGIPTGDFTVDQTALCQGLFGQNTRVRITDIKDGTSNCFMMGERRMGRTCSSWNGNGSTGQGYIGLDGDPAKLTRHAAVGNFCSFWAGIEQQEDFVEILGTTTDGIAIPHRTARIPRRPFVTGRTIKINAKVVPGTNISLHQDDTTIGFNSYHTGGSHFLIGDGTVRFISENVDETTFQNLSRRSDAATLGPF
jgi:hypothetical protein